MHLIQEHLWPGLAFEYRARQSAAGELLSEGRFDEAAAGFENAYRFLRDAQPEGRRYHKGEALHNWGLALFWAGRVQDALRETVAAFIEDAASLAEEDPRFLELDRPAAHNLVFVFGIAGIPLANFGRYVRQFVSAGNPLPDPHVLLATPPAEAAQDGRTDTPSLRIIGQLRASPERAVFIGGWYGRLDTHLRPLRDRVDAIGYDGVVAADFIPPHGWRDDDVALALMGICHYGIFDLTDPAGQMVEIRELSDRKKHPSRTFAVFDARETDRPRVSGGMTLAALADYGILPVGYSDIEHLGRLVGGWLPPVTT